MSYSIFRNVSRQCYEHVSTLLNMDKKRSLVITSIPVIEDATIDLVDNFNTLLNQGKISQIRQFLISKGIYFSDLENVINILKSTSRSDRIRTLGYLLKNANNIEKYTTIVVFADSNRPFYNSLLILTELLYQMIGSKKSLIGVFSGSIENTIMNGKFSCKIEESNRNDFADRLYNRLEMLMGDNTTNNDWITSMKNKQQHEKSEQSGNSGNDWINSMKSKNSSQAQERQVKNTGNSGSSWIEQMKSQSSSGAGRDAQRQKSWDDRMKATIVTTPEDVKLEQIESTRTSIYREIKRENMSLQELSDKVDQHSALYAYIDVKNDDTTVELNKLLYRLLIKATENQISNVSATRKAIDTDINRNDAAYRLLRDKTYALSKDWRNVIIDRITSQNKRQFAVYMGDQYSKFVNKMKLREHFSRALSNMIYDGKIDIKSGENNHYIILDAIFRLNIMPSVFKGYYVVASGTKELSLDTELYLSTLAALSFRDTELNGVIILDNVGFVPKSLDEIQDRYMSANITNRNKVSTVAHDAYSEMNERMYDGNTLGLYRDNQFERNMSIVLSTIYEEIPLIWKNPSPVRPNFKSEGGIVTTPTIFANIKGVGYDPVSKYIDTVNSLIDEQNHKHLLLNKHIGYGVIGYNLMNESTGGFYGSFGRMGGPVNYNNGGGGYSGYTQQLKAEDCEKYFNSTKGILNRSEIEKIWSDKYAILADTKKALLLGAIESACKTYGKLHNITPGTIIVNGLGIDNNILNDITWYDYTKESPKITILMTTADIVIDINDAATLYILNLMGFDIAVFIPTSYRGLEAFLDKSLFDNHDLGEPKFDVQYKEPKVKSGLSSLWSALIS